MSETKLKPKHKRKHDSDVHSRHAKKHHESRREQEESNEILLFGDELSRAASAANSANNSDEEDNIAEADKKKFVVVNMHKGGLVDEADYAVDNHQTHIEFTVDYLDVPRDVAKQHLGRHINKHYQDACQQVHKLALFPAILKQDGIPEGAVYRYRPYFVHISRIITACRIRRLVVQDEYNNAQQLVTRIRELEDKCADKDAKQAQRVVVLESEMDCLVERQQDIDHAKSAPDDADNSSGGTAAAIQASLSDSAHNSKHKKHKENTKGSGRKVNHDLRHSANLFDVVTTNRFNAMMAVPMIFDIIQGFVVKLNKQIQYVAPKLTIDQVLEETAVKREGDETPPGEGPLSPGGGGGVGGFSAGGGASAGGFTALEPYSPGASAGAFSPEGPKVAGGPTSPTSPSEILALANEGAGDQEGVEVVTGNMKLADVQAVWFLLEEYKLFHTVELAALLSVEALEQMHVPLKKEKGGANKSGVKDSAFGRMLATKLVVSKPIDNSRSGADTTQNSGTKTPVDGGVPRDLDFTPQPVGRLSRQSSDLTPAAGGPGTLVRGLSKLGLGFGTPNVADPSMEHTPVWGSRPGSGDAGSRSVGLFGINGASRETPVAAAADGAGLLNFALGNVNDSTGNVDGGIKRPKPISRQVSFGLFGATKADDSGNGTGTGTGTAVGTGTNSPTKGRSRRGSTEDISGSGILKKPRGKRSSRPGSRSGRSTPKPKFQALERSFEGCPFGKWSDICAVLEIEHHRTLMGAAKGLAAHIKKLSVSHPLMLTRMAQLEVTAAINEMHKDDKHSRALSLAIGRITSEIATAVEKVLLVALRSYLPWVQLLENLRKERIRMFGSKVVAKLGGESEMDSQGRTRDIPNADYLIDTDVLHGSSQRLQVSVCRAICAQRISAILDAKLVKQGELACIIQFGYETAMPVLQRVARRWLARLWRLKELRNLTWQARHAAATVIQALRRQVIQKQIFLIAITAVREAKRGAGVLVIQALWRCHAAVRNFNEHKRRKHQERVWFAATSFQAMTRGFVCRQRLKRKRIADENAKNESERLWGAIVIQKIARGYIARHTTIRSMHIRKTLLNQTMQMAERYLGSGDLWGFMKEVSDEFYRLNSELRETREREDKWAYTFVQKVMAKRQGEFDTSWDSFSRVVTAHNAPPTSLSPLRSPPPAIRPDSNAGDTLSNMGGDRNHITKGAGNVQIPIDPGSYRASSSMQNTRVGTRVGTAVTFEDERVVGSPNDGRGEEFAGTGGFNEESGRMSASLLADNVNYTAPSNPQQQQAIPGTLLRRAVASTVSQGISDELAFKVKSQSRSVTLINDIHTAYDDDGSDTNYMRKGSSQASRGGPRQGSTAGMSRQGTAAPGISRQNSTRQGSVKTPSKKKKMTEKEAALLGIELKPRSTLDAISSDWLSASLPPTALEPVNRSSLSLPAIGKPSMKTPNGDQVVGELRGQSVLIDIPMGVEDSVENLLHAAALRCYVPEFFVEGTNNLSTAYQVYLALPPKSLGKIRYETEAFKFSQGAINKLRTKDLSRIRDMMPTSKFIMFMREVGSPQVLTTTCIDLLNTLKAIGSTAARGFTHSISKHRTGRLLAGEGTLDQVKRAGKLSLGTDGGGVDAPDSLSDICSAPPSVSGPQKVVRFGDEQGGDEESCGPDTIPFSSDPNDFDAQMALIYKKLEGDANDSESVKVRKQLNTAVERKNKEARLVANKMLEALVQDGSWNSLNASVDDIILHAAFLTCPYVPEKKDDPPAPLDDLALQDVQATIPEAILDVETSAQGQAALKAHLQYVQTLPPEDARDATKRRYRAALIMSTPFALRLRAANIMNAQSLANVNLGDLDMPLPLKAQVEALLTVVTLTAAKAKPAFSYHDYEATNDEVFTVPLLYDPRFQLGPLDPYGRPPRLGKLDDIKKSPLKPVKSAMKKSRKKPSRSRGAEVRFDSGSGGEASDASMDSDEESRALAADGGPLDLPGGLWDQDQILSPKPQTMPVYGQDGHELVDTSITGAAGNNFVIIDNGEPEPLVSPGKMFGFQVEKEDRHRYAHERDSEWEAYQKRMKSKKDDSGSRHHSRLQSREHSQSNSRVGTSHDSRGGTSAGYRPNDSTVQSSVTDTLDSGSLDLDEEPSTADAKVRAPTASSKSQKRGKSVKKPYKNSKRLESHAPLSATDFTAYVRSGFERPFACSHCNQSFSRAYTLKIHEKSHETFKNYHKFKSEPQLFLDDDKHEEVLANMRKYVEDISLPPLIRNQLEKLGAASGPL